MSERASEGRFYVERLPGTDEPFGLPPAESAHAAGSRRLAVGGLLTLFDGSGWDLTAEIVEVSKRRLVVKPAARRRVGSPLPFTLTCATALPKGSRDDVLVSKCAELGVTRLVPVEFERSVVHASVHWEKRKARYRRLAIEAAKQSGASTVMEFADPVDFASLVADGVRGLRLVGLIGAQTGVFEALRSGWPFESVLCLVGPEGDITAKERDAALAAGFTGVTLAPTVLRVETAATAFAAVVAAFAAGKAGPKGA